MNQIKNKFVSAAKRVLNQKEHKANLAMYERIYPAAVLAEKRFYNIGAGQFRHQYWTNVDNPSAHYNKLFGKDMWDIEHDLLERTPISVSSGSAELIYTSHTIEHLDQQSTQFLFADCYRMLREGGIFRIATPDIELIYRAWRAGDRDFFYWSEFSGQNEDPARENLIMPMSKASLSQIFLLDFAASVAQCSLEGTKERIDDARLEELFRELPFEEALDYCSSRCPVELQRRFPSLHINWFNEKKIRVMLAQAGFKQVYRSGYLQSFAPVMRQRGMFDATNPECSLYMEAVK